MYGTGRQHGSVYICSGGTEFMADIIAFPHEGLHRYTILIVDDEPAIRGFLYDYLSQCGFNPLTAASGDEAVAMLKKEISVDLVFSDVRMPGGMDGCAMARWILQNWAKLLPKFVKVFPHEFKRTLGVPRVVERYMPVAQPTLTQAEAQHG